MDLKELSKLDVKDLKNINYSQLLQDLRQKPFAVVSVVVIVGTLLFCYRFYSQKKKQSVEASRAIPLLEKKIEAKTSYEQTKKKFDDFMADIPPFLADEDLVNFMADLAQQRRIRIKSFSPGKTVSMPKYDRFKVTLEVSAESYKDLCLFVYDLESAPYALSVVKFQSSMAQAAKQAVRSRRRNVSTEQQEQGISFSLEIVSVDIKKNEK